MRVYLTVVYEYESVEDVANDGLPGDNALGYIREPVSAASPVVLSGLVKGGEIRTLAEWKNTPGGSLYVDAANRPYLSGARAVAYGALPITWYRYEEP